VPSRCTSRRTPTCRSSPKEPPGEGGRVDSGYALGNTVTPFYDPLMVKLCGYGRTHAEALGRAREAVAGNNLPFCLELLERPESVDGKYDTGLVSRMRA
jgi:acetyl-CoA carboxylase, biotin carboxylase subunit